MNKIFFGDCVETLQSLPEKFVHTCVTSPPYFGLRSYDENAVKIDPTLHQEKRAWLESELVRRGIYASR